MRAIYDIKDCCGDLLDTIEIELPAEFDDPAGCLAEAFALGQSDYANPGICRDCRGYSARASFHGSPIAPIWSELTIEGLNRDVLITDLERIIQDLRVMPKEVSFVECNALGGCIG